MWHHRKNVTDILTRDCMWKKLTRGSHRYSNTLFVSLNNRIYFRDYSQVTAGIHIVREHVIESDLSHRSVHITSAGSTVHETTLGSDSYALKTISHAIDLSKEKGDTVSINSDPM
jgi:hypothetical protein